MQHVLNAKHIKHMFSIVHQIRIMPIPGPTLNMSNACYAECITWYVKYNAQHVNYITSQTHKIPTRNISNAHLAEYAKSVVSIHVSCRNFKDVA